MKRIVPLLAATFVAAALPALAQHDHSGHGMSMGATASAPAKDFTKGEVKGIDKQAGKVTLKHGEISNLGMPAMTMVFKAKDPAALGKLKVGDAVAFKAENLGGVYTVTEIKQGS
jgi:Cu(I)/Ag(I) efflux system periplasmic protein CusF